MSLAHLIISVLVKFRCSSALPKNVIVQYYYFLDKCIGYYCSLWFTYSIHLTIINSGKLLSDRILYHVGVAANTASFRTFMSNSELSTGVGYAASVEKCPCYTCCGQCCGSSSIPDNASIINFKLK